MISWSYNFLFNPNLCGWGCYEFSYHIFCWIIKSCAAFYAALHFKIFFQSESPTLSCPCLHLLKFLLYELFPTARMSEFFYSLVKLMCFATMLLIMNLYVCWVSYSYIILDLFYYLDSSCLLQSLNSWLSLGYQDFGAVLWFNSLSLSLTGAWNQGFWLPVWLHLQMIQQEQ